VFEDLRGGFAVFRARRWVWTFVAGAAVGNMVWAAWTALGPLLAANSLGGAAAWGIVLSAMGAGGLSGGVLAMHVLPRRPLATAVLGVAVSGLPLALLAEGAPLAPVALAAFVAGAALMLANTLWESTLQRHVPLAALSRVSAYDWLGSMACKPLGLAIWGPLAALMGAGDALWLAVALNLTTALVLLGVPEIRRMPGRSEAAPAPAASLSSAAL
jgi:hypothetical protein